MSKNPFYNQESELQNLYPEGMGSFDGSGGGGSGFTPTPSQINAMNSGITGAKVADYDSAVGKINAIINDSITSLTKTWSSSKINDLFASLSGGIDAKVVTTMPVSPENNTMYFVGPKGTSPNQYYEQKLRVDDVTYDCGTTQVPLSNYYNKTQVDNMMNNKQDKLISGTNIKTLNGETLLGSGNIEVKGGVGVETSLWDGNKIGDWTCNLSDNWHNFDYIKFYYKDGGSFVPSYTIAVDTLEAAFDNSTYAQMLIPISWNSTDIRLIIFKSGSSDTALKININNVYITKIVGIKGGIDIQTVPIVKDTIISGMTDASGFFKVSGQSFKLPTGGKVITGVRVTGTTASFNTGFMFSIYQQRYTGESENSWSIKITTWDNVAIVNTNFTIQVFYV